MSGWFTAEKSSDGVISYSVSKNESEEARSGNLTISVSGGNTIVIPVSQAGYIASGVERVVTFDYSEVTDTDHIIEYISLSTDANGGNEPAVNKSSSELRIYRYNKFTIAGTTSNVSIKSIIFTLSSASNCGYNFMSDPAGYVLDGTTGTWNGDSNSIVFSNGGDDDNNVQFRVKKIDVTYTLNQ